MNINNVIDAIMQFYSRIYYQTGLKSWQLLTIALVVLFLLVLLSNYLRKARLRKMHLIQSTGRSEIIGIKLSGRENRYQAQADYRKKQESFIPDEDEEQKSWGQSTKEWRKLREKIMYLQRDIKKHERTEKHYKEQITELKNINEKLRLEISKQAKSEQETSVHNLRNQIIENKTYPVNEKYKEDFDQADINEVDNNVPLDIKELKTISEMVKRLQERGQQRQSE